MSTLASINVVLDKGAFMPERAHPGEDAGADLRCMEDVTVFAKSSATINTGVHMELPHGTAGLLVAKSGLNIKFKLLSTGLIDEGFTGPIMVELYNHSDKPYTFHRGDKVSQIVIMPVYYPEFKQVEEITGGERGDSGYGSTGR